MNKVKFILPDFMALARNQVLIDLYEKHSHVVYENSIIYSFYGTFPGCLWNGGRPDISDIRYDEKFMSKIRDFYNSKGIAITFTFTNSQLTEEHLNDEYCNKILQIFQNGINEILVASDLLENYIRKNYPNYKINRSITANHFGKYDYEKYNLVVIDKKYNRDFEYLKEINQKDKVEILCDETCVNDCRFTQLHYKEISELQLGKKPPNDEFGNCRHSNNIKRATSTYIAYRNRCSKYYIPPTDIKKYSKMGFQYFKLSGREKFNVVGYESIIQYLIKPEYQIDIKIYIYEQLMLEVDNHMKKKTIPIEE